LALKLPPPICIATGEAAARSPNIWWRFHEFLETLPPQQWPKVEACVMANGVRLKNWAHDAEPAAQGGDRDAARRDEKGNIISGRKALATLDVRKRRQE